MAEGLGSSIESLVGQSHLRELLPQCCQDPSPDVRQSAFALVGDLSRVCAPHLQPVVKQLLALAIQNMEARCINPPRMSACNNSCWSLSELPLVLPTWISLGEGFREGGAGEGGSAWLLEGCMLVREYHIPLQQGLPKLLCLCVRMCFV